MNSIADNDQKFKTPLSIQSIENSLTLGKGRDLHSPASVLAQLSPLASPLPTPKDVTITIQPKTFDQNGKNLYLSSSDSKSACSQIQTEESSSNSPIALANGVAEGKPPQTCVRYSISYNLEKATFEDEVVGSGMSASIQVAHVPTTTTITTTEGESTTSIALNKMALKVFKRSHINDQNFQRECRALEILRECRGVIAFYGSCQFYGSDKMFLEYAPRGDLMDTLLQFSEGFPESIAWTFARQLWNTLADCHKRGVCHRDIKPENILIFEDWDIKLADFGTAHFLNALDHPYLQSSSSVTGADQPGSSTSVEYCGTQIYIAPEVSHHVPYKPTGADVWSAGIVTFTLLFGVPPFYDSSPSCWYFKCAQEGKWELFWQQHEKARPNLDPLPDSAKHFLQRALDTNPHTRPSASDLKRDPWLASLPKIVLGSHSSGGGSSNTPGDRFFVQAFMQKSGLDFKKPGHKRVGDA